MKLNLKITAGLLIFCTACSNVKETPKGMTYTVVKKGDGIAPKKGQFIVYSFVFKDAKDSVWFDNRKQDAPEAFPFPDSTNLKTEEGLGEIFRYVTKGDSLTLKIKAADLFAKTLKQPLPPKIDPKSEFFFAIGIKDVISQEDFMKVRQVAQAKQKEKFMKDQVAQLGKDTVSIDSILKAKNIAALTTPTGLRYTILKKGTGPLVKKGQKVKVEYAGYLPSGKYFDTNIESVAKAHALNAQNFKPMELEAGVGRVIPGFDQAFLLMNKGEKITLFIPSTLAYGPRRASQDIGPNSILIFDIEMLDATDVTASKK